MFQVSGYVFKRAETREEFEQIHALNYRTFVGEIPQHPDPGDQRLVDKFHDKNAYFIALRQGKLAGMVSVHDQPPFSISSRLDDPSILTQPGMRPLEIRLLAIEPDRRNSTVFGGLIWLLYHHAAANGHTDLFISGVEKRLPLYRHIGFEPVGPAVPYGDARFVPMAVKVEKLPTKHSRFVQLWEKQLMREALRRSREPQELEKGKSLVCLLPGPVTVAPAVTAAFHQPAIYHRGAEFIALYEKVRRTLTRMVHGHEVALFNGSGTLGNEVVAATLAAESMPARGILLVNGEFGHRLAQQAARFGLNPRILRWEWGQPWNLDEIGTALAHEPRGTWIWGVHQESSTGILNDLPALVDLAKSHQARVCVDCISSLGAVPIDLEGVYLATGATGKALGSFAGTAIVFADSASLRHLEMSRVPSYFDLPATLATRGPRYTFPSATLQALAAALTEYATSERATARYEGYARLGEFVRSELRQLGLEPLAAEAHASPVVTTFAPPANESSEVFVARCRQWGYVIGGQSGYLAERRLVQIATMGAITRDACAPLFEHLRQWMETGSISMTKEMVSE